MPPLRLALSSELAPARAPGRRRAPCGFICALVGLGALAVALVPLHVPNALFGVHPYPSGYDDGVYLGAALRLVHGIPPYRDFLFIQPPGILLLLSPVALLGRAIGSDDALAATRLLTALVMGANAALAALVLRRRGRLAMAIGGGALALYPLAGAASLQSDLEPYVVLLVLASLLVALSSEHLTRFWLLLAGALVGFAAATKLSAVIPAGLLALVFAPAWARVRAVVEGALLGFVLPCLVFFSFAPTAALREVFLDQLTRADPHVLSSAQRLVMISGIGGPANLGSRSGIALALVLGLAGLGALVYARAGRTLDRLEIYAGVTAPAVLAEFLVAHEFYDHYAYLCGCFLALLVGVLAARVTAIASTRWPRLRSLGVGLVAALVLALAAGFAVPHIVDFEHGYVASSFNPAHEIDAVTRPGQCVVSDQATLLIVADRFDAARAHCPAVVDSYGLFIAEDYGHPPPGVPPPQSFVSIWYLNFIRAHAVVLRGYLDTYIPWNDALIAYFNERYTLVAARPGVDVYRHR